MIAEPDGARPVQWEGTRKLLALGYQGFGNVGDEAVLTGIEALLRGSTLKVTTVVAGRVANVAAFVDARRLLQRRILLTPSAVRSLLATDGIILAGGGLLHDHWWDVLPRYASWVLAATILRKKVIWLGVGVGPLRHRLSRLLVAAMTRLSDLVLVRDGASASLLRRVGGRVDAVVPDPAYFNDPVTPSDLTDRMTGGSGCNCSETPSATRPIALIVRWPLSRKQDLAIDLADALAGFAVRVMAEDAVAVHLLTFAGRRDSDFAALVAQRARQRGAGEIHIIDLPADPRMALTVLAAHSGVVSVRLHGLIMAALLGLPFVGVAYDDKVIGVLEDLGAGELVVPLDRVSPDTLRETWIRAREPSVLKQVAANVARQRELQTEVRERLEMIWQ